MDIVLWSLVSFSPQIALCRTDSFVTLDPYVLCGTNKESFQSWHYHVFLGESRSESHPNLGLVVWYTSYEY